MPKSSVLTVLAAEPIALMDAAIAVTENAVLSTDPIFSTEPLRALRSAEADFTAAEMLFSPLIMTLAVLP